LNIYESNSIYQYQQNSAPSQLPVPPVPAPVSVPVSIPVPVPIVQEILQPVIVPYRSVPIRPRKPKYHYKKYENYGRNHYNNNYKKSYKNDYQDKYSKIKEWYRDRMTDDDLNEEDETNEDYYANDSNQLYNMVNYLDKYYKKSSYNYEKKDEDEKYKHKNGKIYSNKKSYRNNGKYKSNSNKEKSYKLSSIIQPDDFEYYDINDENDLEYLEYEYY